MRRVIRQRLQDTDGSLTIATEHRPDAVFGVRLRPSHICHEGECTCARQTHPHSVFQRYPEANHDPKTSDQAGWRALPTIQKQRTIISALLQI
jgi:hypothetical protein